MLEVSNLTAIRDERVLFESLSFQLKAGELVQVEGRNGTGKTTLLRIITGLGDRDEGTISWDGQSIESNRDAYHQNLLFLGHQTGVKRELSAYENPKLLPIYSQWQSKQGRTVRRSCASWFGRARRCASRAVVCRTAAPSSVGSFVVE